MTAGGAQRRLAEDIAGFAANPYRYALYAFPWGEGALQGIEGPRRWQIEVMREIGDHLSNPETRFTPLRIAVASGHGPGKSAAIGMLCKWALDTCPDTRIVITANTDGQLQTKTSPELAKWHNLSITKSWFRQSVTSITSTQKGHERSWRADLIPWSIHSPEAFAGLHNQGRRIVIFYDEASNIHDRIWEVTEGALTDEQTEIIWIAFGNPSRNTGRFREAFSKHRHLWKTRHIDSRTVEGTNKQHLQELVDTYGEDSDFVKVRVRGLFPSASSMQFIASETVSAAMERPSRDSAILPNDPIIFGVDHARFGDDSSVLAIRQGRDARSRRWKVWNGANSMEIAGDIAAEAARYSPDAIMVDAGGPNAGGVIDRLRQLLGESVPIFEINFGAKGREANWDGVNRVRVANKRAEMYTNLRAWLERGCLPNITRLSDDLTALEYGYNADNAIQLERKEHLRARGLPSSDYSDALALTFAEHVEARALPTYLMPAQEREYDRYAELDQYNRYSGEDRYDRH
ncbi:terminase [Sphingomonas rhizophila]|uniref:Terminase n=1 Tax=Sphingomonas rhizophila TaxID=2071607 RepID=A0A7G9S918_9SPHN|nr:terminase [Sphingomonas rhizophila]QNN64343.1 terminase [Sphingomonas rhizophila]